LKKSETLFSGQKTGFYLSFKNIITLTFGGKIMKKIQKQLSQLALLGLGAGILASCQNANSEKSADKDSSKIEQGLDFLKKLDTDTQALFQSLNEEGQELAKTLVNQSCGGHNACKGLNSCKSDKNNCAGQGSCKGQSSCSFKDPNLAVKVAAQKMAEKREESAKPSTQVPAGGSTPIMNGMHKRSSDRNSSSWTNTWNSSTNASQ
jgi:hypothetical protein